MPDMPVIAALTPVTIPPVEEKVFNYYRVKQLLFDGNNPNNPLVVIAKLHKSAQLSDGSVEFHPLEDDVVIRIDNLFAEAAVDMELAMVVGGILTYLNRKVVEALTPPEPIQ